MRSSTLGAFAGALIFAVPPCVYVPAEPAPPYPYAEPVPVAPPPGPRRLCGWGWHWVHAHHDRSGHWVPGHCVRNWVGTPHREEPSPEAPLPSPPPADPPNPPPDAPLSNPGSR